MTRSRRLCTLLLAVAVGWLIAVGPASAAPGAYGTVNLARGIPVTPLTNTVGGSPAAATDGDPETVWWSYQGWPVQNSFVLDLGRSYRLGLLTVIPGQTHAFVVSTSEDCVTYTLRYITPWANTSIHMVPIPIAADGMYSARCIQYVGQATYPQYVGMYELEVYEWVTNPPPPPPGSVGTVNLALNRPAVNILAAPPWYSPDLAANPPTFAVDGQDATWWLGNHAGRDNWNGKYGVSGHLKIDLGAPVKLGRIVVKPHGVQSYWVRMSPSDVGYGDMIPPAGSPMVSAVWPALFGTSSSVDDAGTYDLYGSVTARYVYVSMVNFAPYWMSPGISDVEVYEWVEGAPDTVPPVLTVPPAISAEAAGPAGAVVTYTATALDEVDGAVPVTCDHASGSTFPIGTTTVTCAATDAAGNMATAAFTVTVRDVPPPVIGSVVLDRTVLWPPNHQLVPVTVAVDFSSPDPAATCGIAAVTSSEPVNGLGDGDTTPDWVLPGGLTVALRAERAGNGAGRIYTVTVECTDSAGRRASRTALVTVPLSQKPAASSKK